MSPLRPLAGLLASGTLLFFGNGILLTLLPLWMTRSGFSAVAIGLLTAAHAGGFLLGCLMAPRMVRNVGHIRVFAGFAAILAVASLALTLAVDAALWFPLRLVTGLASATLFTTIESWLNAAASRRDRGRILSVYMILNRLAYALGQMSLAWVHSNPATFAIFGGAIYAFSLVPISIGTSAGPAGPVPRVPPSGGVRRLIRRNPLAVAGCFASGATVSAVFGLTPVYVADFGQSTGTAAYLMALMQLGGLLFQWPVGWLSDRQDRDLIMALIAGGAALVSLPLALIPLGGGPPEPSVMGFLMCLWGGFSLPLYPLSVAQANDRAEPTALVAISSGLLMIWSIGAVSGPLLVSVAIAQSNTAALFWSSVCFNIALMMLVLGGRRLLQNKSILDDT